MIDPDLLALVAVAVGLYAGMAWAIDRACRGNYQPTSAGKAQQENLDDVE